MQAAPLIGIAQAPIPDGARAFWLEADDGARLRAALFEAQAPARGSVVLSPGRAEPIEKYFEVIEDLRARGFHVLAHDWRGQGLSARALPDRLKGHAEGFEPFLADYAVMLDRVGARLPKPWIGLAHSMGGALVLLALARGEGRLAGVLASAPMIGLHAVRVAPRLAGVIARAVVGCGLGGLYVQASEPFDQPFAGNILTHDRARYERFLAQLKACPDLALGGPTWGWLDFALAAGAALDRPDTPAGLRLPISIVAAGDDRLVLSACAKRFAARAPEGRFVQVPNAYHEIMMETDPVRATFWREFDALASRISARSV